MIKPKGAVAGMLVRMPLPAMALWLFVIRTMYDLFITPYLAFFCFFGNIIFASKPASEMPVKRLSYYGLIRHQK